MNDLLPQFAEDESILLTTKFLIHNIFRSITLVSQNE